MKGNNLKKVIATIVMACLLLTMVGVSSKEDCTLLVFRREY